MKIKAFVGVIGKYRLAVGFWASRKRGGRESKDVRGLQRDAEGHS